jgi:transposase
MPSPLPDIVRMEVQLRLQRNESPGHIARATGAAISYIYKLKHRVAETGSIEAQNTAKSGRKRLLNAEQEQVCM